jgi:LPXTG-site transpeptidase (sortase) family protein
MTTLTHTFKKVALIIILVVAILVLFSPSSFLNKSEAVPASAVPVTISIGSIGIEDAPIEAVGMINGSMGTALFANNVGWYSLGTKPGEIGSAVLAGHVNWLGGNDAVFTRLKQVEEGDIITIKNSHDETFLFMVREIKKYPVDGDTTEVFSSDDDKSHLNLITCSGIWNPLRKTHESRLVVFSDAI